MKPWEWDESYSIGIGKIDEQHKQMIWYINELQVAFAYNKIDIVEEVLDKLKSYTISHFSYEESLLEKGNYPHLAEHKKAHEAFINRINFFKERYENGENVAKQLRSDLQLWVIHHIKEDDFDYKDFFNKKS